MTNKMTDAKRAELKARHNKIKQDAANRAAIDKCVRAYHKAVFTK